ncbi:MAG: LamG-like jellyroll fold domain-containing protein, partial [Candidatus Methanosuratincola sp.]
MTDKKTACLLFAALFSALLVLFGTFYGFVNSQAQDQALVGFWNFDEGSGGMAYDSSGHGNNGTVYGAAWASGKWDGALHFDGDGDYVNCGNDETLDPTEAATIEAWVFLDQLPSTAGHIMEIASRSGSGTDLDLQIETDNRFKFFVGPGAPNVAVSNTVAQANRWYHVAGTYVANRTVSIYINGVLEKTTPISIARNTNVYDFCIGQSCYWYGRFFNGTIDEVKIYSRALTPEEIWAEYASVRPSIWCQSALMDVGQSQNFTSETRGGTQPYSYQWYLNETPVAGATGASWTFIPTSIGYYIVYLKVLDVIGTVGVSTKVTVNVNEAPSVSISPESAVMDVGQSKEFASSISGGTAPYSYQWYLDGAAVSGANSQTWVFTPASLARYNIYLKVTDAVGVTALSSTVEVNVNEAPSVSISPESAVMDVGQSKEFASSISGGTAPYSYQWYLD